MGLIVAIDGVSGSGKSTVAKELALRLGVEALDTGAMYRTVAWLALECGADFQDELAVTGLLRELRINVNAGRVTLRSPFLTEAGLADQLDDGDGLAGVQGAVADNSPSRDLTQAIRTPEVTAAASAISQNLAVRQYLQELQRSWVRARGGGVVEGRDIGTEVFPHASYKFYLTASPEVRAQRRAAELNSRPEQVLDSMVQRDLDDQSRQHSPLRPANDAIEVDTSQTDASGAVELLLRHINATQPCTASPPGAAENDTAENGAAENDIAERAAATPYDYPVAERYGDKRSWLNRLNYTACRCICWLLGVVYVRYRVKNRHKLPKRGPVIVAPGGHRSNFDTPFAGMAVSRMPAYMAKESLFKSPRWAAFIAFFGGFPVLRDTLDRQALKVAQKVLEQGDVLILFPEGTRQQGPELQPLFEGVAWLSAKTGAPVLPLGIGGSEKVLPVGAKIPRPRPVRMVFGDLLEPPGGPVAAADGSSSGSKRRRASMQELAAFTEELRAELQAVFDEAQEWAGTPNQP